MSQVDTVSSLHKDATAQETTRNERAESLQRNGKRMVFTGFAITILGVLLYCAVSFAEGANVDMGDVLLRNAAPLTRATLAVLGIGTLIWLIGSFTYLRGMMDADEEAENSGE